MINLKSKLGIAAAAIAITGGLLTSAAFADEAPEAAKSGFVRPTPGDSAPAGSSTETPAS